MKTLLVILGLVFAGTINVQAQSYVNGYTRGNGTYVAPYIRSNPDGYKFNNYGCMNPKR